MNNDAELDSIDIRLNYKQLILFQFNYIGTVITGEHLKTACNVVTVIYFAEVAISGIDLGICLFQIPCISLYYF